MNIFESAYVALYESEQVPASLKELSSRVNFLINNSRDDEARSLVASFKAKNPAVDTSSILVIKNSPWRYAFYHAPSSQKKSKLIGWLSDYMSKGQKNQAELLLNHIRRNEPSVDTTGIELSKLLTSLPKPDIKTPAGVKVFNGVVTAATRSVPYLVDTIINKIEQGYVNPASLQGPERAAFSTSGETMFGLDRKRGADYAKFADSAWKSFWNAVDNGKRSSPQSWKRYYMGGPLEQQLRRLAHAVIEPNLSNYLASYLSQKSKAIVEGDGRLLFMFVESMFNGLGYFQKMATEVNRLVESGVINTPTIISRILASHRRLDSRIASRVDTLSQIVGVA